MDIYIERVGHGIPSRRLGVFTRIEINDTDSPLCATWEEWMVMVVIRPLLKSCQRVMQIRLKQKGKSVGGEEI